jgi:hypothetical protein
VKVIRNDRYIEKRSKIGRYTSLAGLAVLAVGMVISIAQPQFIAASFACLVLGFIMSQVGIYYGNRFVRLDRPDEVLTKALKGFDDKYLLYHYSLPVPHVLLTPEACYVFNVQQQTGRVSARGDKWKQSMGWKWLFAWAAQESLGNPAKSAQLEADTLARNIEKVMPGLDVTPTPVVVFSNPAVELDVQGTAVPIVHIKQLKDWVRGAKGSGLGTDVYKQLVELFGHGK